MQVAFLRFLAVGAAITIAACGDDSSNGGGNSEVPPAGCPTCKTVGAICYREAQSTCDGTWYCWSDHNWHCAPVDAGGPGGPADATLSDDGGSDAPEASPPADSSSEAGG